MRTVAILGLGLIGGSMAMALRREGRFAGRVIGYDLDPAVMSEALGLGAVDATAETAEQAALDAGLVVVATPVASIPEVVARVAPVVRPGTVITDVASTKQGICRAVRPLIPETVTFVGGHPMAGSERAGIRAADPYLFENAVYVVTPLPGSGEQAIAAVQGLARALGAHPLLLTPEEHDLAVAAVSHLPHVVAASLVRAVADVATDRPYLWSLAAGGFRDTTRIAGSDPVLWRQILLANRDAVVDLLEGFLRQVGAFRRALEAGDGARLEELLGEARALRSHLPSSSKGILSQIWDLVVQVIDRPGAIAEVTGHLARNGINIIDIEILRVREGEGGTLRLGFDRPQTLEAALEVLHREGYRVRRR